MATVFASLVKLPTFKNNYVKDGMVASYDSETNAIEVKKTDLVEDTDPENNVFRKVFKKLPEHQKILKDCFDGEKYKIIDSNDSGGLTVVDMSWEEYEKEFLTARKMRYTNSENKSYHVIHPEIEYLEEEDSGKVFSLGNDEADTKYKDFVGLQQKMKWLKNDTMPIVTIQFLFVLIQNLKCSSATVLSHADMCEELSDDFEDFDEDKDDRKNSKKQKTFKFFPNLFDKDNENNSIESFKKYVEEGDRIIMETQHGGWYVLRTGGNNKEDRDEVDGEISDILLQIGNNLLTTLVKLVSKHIKKYIQKQQQKRMEC